MMFFLHEYLDQIYSREFVLDCHEIVLTQNETNEPATIRGPGIIWLDDNGDLQFKILSSIIDGDYFAVFATLKLSAGEFLPESGYYTMTAEGSNGLQFTSDRVCPFTTKGPPGPYVVTGTLPRIEHCECLPIEALEQATMDIYLFDEFKFPANEWHTQSETIEGIGFSHGSIPASKFEAAGFEFHFVQKPGRYQISILCLEKEIPPHLERRVIESFQFALSKLLTVSCTTTIEGVQKRTSFRPPGQRREETLGKPPTNVRSVDPHPQGSAIDIISKFFSYIFDFEGSATHPISELVYSVISSRAAGYDAHALALGVAVEGVVNLAFRDIEAVPP